MTMTDSPNESWLNGGYMFGEIDTAYGTVLVDAEYTSEGQEFFAQGEDADRHIKEIHNIWLTKDCTQEEAFLEWININL